MTTFPLARKASIPELQKVLADIAKAVFGPEVKYRFNPPGVAENHSEPVICTRTLSPPG